MKNAQTATVASSCIETSPKTLRRKPGQPKRSNSSLRRALISALRNPKRRGLSFRPHGQALSRQVGLQGDGRPHRGCCGTGHHAQAGEPWRMDDSAAWAE